MKRLAAIFIVFLTLAALYFSRIEVSGKLAYPVAFLGFMALMDSRNIGIAMAIGLVCSAFGDWQGTQGNFLGQMGCFALAHVAYICYFTSRMKGKPNGWLMAIGLATVLVIGVVAATKVIPQVPEGVMQIGVSIYCLLILTMLLMALMQRDWLFALGAALFVCSDFILAWNKFVSPVGHASWMIMVPYYTAQWLLFFRATCVTSNACSCTSPDR